MVNSYFVKLRNAFSHRQQTCILKVNTNFLEVLRILEAKGFIRSFQVLDSFYENRLHLVKISFGYFEGKPLLSKIRCFESERRARYFSYHALKKYCSNAPGMFLLSTDTQGICTQSMAIKQKVGGFVLAYIS